MIEWSTAIAAAGGSGTVQLIVWAFKSFNQNARDRKRRAMLRKMLNEAEGDGWRTLETLSNVIGADRDKTTRLLIEIDARGSEKDGNLWTYEKRHPIPTKD